MRNGEQQGKIFFVEASRANDPTRRALDQGEEELSADAFDPVIEVFKRDMDFTLVERNLRLTTEERAQQLLNATGLSTNFVRWHRLSFLQKGDRLRKGTGGSSWQ